MRDYTQTLTEFYGWFDGRIRRTHENDLDEYQELVDSRIALLEELGLGIVVKVFDHFDEVHRGRNQVIPSPRSKRPTPAADPAWRIVRQ